MTLDFVFGRDGADGNSGVKGLDEFFPYADVRYWERFHAAACVCMQLTKGHGRRDAAFVASITDVKDSFRRIHIALTPCFRIKSTSTS